MAHAGEYHGHAVFIGGGDIASLAIAAAGGGLALAHDAIAARMIEQGQLIAPFTHRAPMQEAYYLILSPQADRMPGAVAFANWLRAELFTHRKSRVMNISPEPRPIMAACDDAL